MTTPDAITPVEGYRAWKWTGGNLTPTSVDGKPWVPGTNEALCFAAPPLQARRNVDGRARYVVVDEPHHDLIPDENCRCGLWFLHSLAEVRERVPVVPDLGSSFPIARPVYGKIKGWGKVLVGKRGYRAEFAEILCLYAPTNDLEWQREIAKAALVYGVPVEVTDEVNLDLPPDLSSHAHFPPSANPLLVYRDLARRLNAGSFTIHETPKTPRDYLGLRYAGIVSIATGLVILAGRFLG